MDLDSVAEALYALPPDEFTAARTDREKEARAAGDRELAAEIHHLGKPTVAAWLANQLARERSEEIGPLLDLGAGLRTATATLSGDDLRQLDRLQHQLIHALVQQGRGLAGSAGRRVSDDMVRGLEDTLYAALADPGAADQLRAGRLTETLRRTGFPATAPSNPPAPPAPAARPAAVTSPAPRTDRRREAAARRQALELERATRDEDEARAAAHDADEARADARARAEQAAADLHAGATELHRLQGERDPLQAELDRLRREIDRLTTEIDRASDEQSHREQEQRAAQARVADADRAAEDAARRLADAEQRLRLLQSDGAEPG